jgi:UDP-2,3-diacylglucosamine pyrophosphatase LpxH
MRRVISISDLHIGGDEYPMLGHPQKLTDFLTQLAAYSPDAGEEVELVINGDFVDFLAEKPGTAWTTDEGAAVAKLENVFRRSPEIFDALARCAHVLSRFTILLGNHDVELAYPRVREALFRRLGTNPHRCLFIYNNESYRIGELLIEHGNRYDTWNAIDHEGLREIVSCSTRGESPPRGLSVCPGSRFVQDVVNPLKERYHFIDLLKPEDKLIALLLTTFEPSLKLDVPLLFRGATSYIQQHYRAAHWNLVGARPGQRHLVASTSSNMVPELPPDVAVEFREELAEAAGGRQLVGTVEKLQRAFLRDRENGLKAKLERGEVIDSNRVKKLQTALRHVVATDRSFDESNLTDQYANAAGAMIEASVARVVIMGHTHLRRNITFAGGGRYLNTGTWADLIRVPADLLESTDDARAALVTWLARLATNRLDGIRQCEPTYADVRINDEGHVIFDERRPMLRQYDGLQFI